MKKALFLFLAIILVVSAFPVSTAFAATADKVVYLDGTKGKDTNTGADAANAVATMEKAISLLAANGGTITVSGDTVIDTGIDANAQKGHNIVFPEHKGTIHIKGVKNSDGTYTKLIKTAPGIFSTFGFRGDLIISDITFKTAQQTIICMRGNDLTMGLNISVEKDIISADSGVWIYGYSQTAADAGSDASAYTYNQTLNIFSGDYDLISATGASGSMKLNGTDTVLQKVTGDIVINIYGGTISGVESKIVSAENSGEVVGNVTVNLYKGVGNFENIKYEGRSTKISDESILNLYNFTSAEVETIKSKVVADSNYTKINGTLTGTVPTPSYLVTTPTTTTTTSPTTWDASYIMGMGMALSLAALFVAYTQRKKAFCR